MADETETTTEREYLVELPMTVVGASTPEEAVEGFIEQIVTYGQRAWVYLVTDRESGTTVRVRTQHVAGSEIQDDPIQVPEGSEEEEDEPQPERTATESE